MKKNIILPGITMVLVASGCSKKNTQTEFVTSDSPQIVKVDTRPRIGTPPRALLNATVFKMSGDYANNVAVTLNADGTFAYYPAPSDISAASHPIDLGNGWWLNRQGIGPRSRFLRYTFEEYASLPSVPSQEELLKAIIPGAEVTEFKSVNVPASEAMSRLDEVKKLAAE